MVHVLEHASWCPHARDNSAAVYFACSCSFVRAYMVPLSKKRHASMGKLAHAAETRSVLVVYTTKKLNFWSHPLLVLNMISTISECNKSLPPDDAG